MAKTTKISKFLEIVETDNGSYAYCPAGDAVRIIPPIIRILHKNGTSTDYMLFVEEYRYPVGKKIYNLPGGRLNIGEEGMKAIVRELLEETGLTIDVDSVKIICESSFKDAQNSQEKEALYMCPQVICLSEEKEDVQQFINKLNNNQHLDEGEECKIKLVSLNNISEFMQSTDMCLPSRLALINLLSQKRINMLKFPQIKATYSTKGENLKPETQLKTSNITAKSVDAGFPYCYYSPANNNRVSALMQIDVEGKKYYAFKQQQFETSNQPITTLPFYDFSGTPDDTKVLGACSKILNNEILLDAAFDIKQITPFDPVSPGITDLRQSIVMIKLKYTKEEFKVLTETSDLILVEEGNLAKCGFECDYITDLVVKTCIQLNKNKTKEDLKDIGDN